MTRREEPGNIAQDGRVFSPPARRARSLGIIAAVVVAIASIFAWFARTNSAPLPHLEGFESGIIDPLWWHDDVKGECSIDVVSGPARTGTQSVRFTAGIGARCEIVHWPRTRLLQWLHREPFDEPRWYAMSIYLPRDRAPGLAGRNEVVAQWHASGDVWLFETGGRGPPLALRIQENRWRITSGSDPNFRSSPGNKAKRLLWEGPAALGQWTDWLFHVVWSYREGGRTEIWKDGQKLVTYVGPNAYNDLRGVYLKLGSYHPRADQVVYLDDVRVGKTCRSIFDDSDERARVCEGTDPP
jgi:hypothetical protein